MAACDGAEVCIVFSPVKDAALGRADSRGPEESEWKGPSQFDVFGWRAGCRLWGPSGGGEMPIGLCDRFAGLVSIGPAPFFAVDIRIHEETGEKQPGRGSIRTK